MTRDLHSIVMLCSAASAQSSHDSSKARALRRASGGCFGRSYTPIDVHTGMLNSWGQKCNSALSGKRNGGESSLMKVKGGWSGA